ncbi:MAG: hypothetical protein HZA52_14465 [Planctomycetes bacterium]|nr:hypothetical protein [Planctomycetota bacterium]
MTGNAVRATNHRLVVIGGLGGIGLALVAFAMHVYWNVSGRSRPWTEDPTQPSPDRRYVVSREGRSAFMDLEAQVTIAPVAMQVNEQRDVLVPWSERLPVHVEWTGPSKLVIELAEGPPGDPRPLESFAWRDVEVRLLSR